MISGRLTGWWSPMTNK